MYRKDRVCRLGELAVFVAGKREGRNARVVACPCGFQDGFCLTRFGYEHHAAERISVGFDKLIGF